MESLNSILLSCPVSREGKSTDVFADRGFADAVAEAMGMFPQKCFLLENQQSEFTKIKCICRYRSRAFNEDDSEWKVAHNLKVIHKEVVLRNMFKT